MNSPENLATLREPRQVSGRVVTPVVGVGASSGAIEALELFFKSVPDDLGMAFVVVTHLDPRYKSSMAVLLQRCTRMTVLEITNGTPVEANTVYLIPPNAELAIREGVLFLTSPTQPQRGFRTPVNFFFRALADDCGPLAVGLVLSGTGNDGTQGMRDIQRKGGLTVVQNPTQARYPGMPQSVIQAGFADEILPAEEVCKVLVRFKNDRAKNEKVKDEKIKSDMAWRSSGVSFAPLQAAVEAKATVDSMLEKIVTLLRKSLRHDFSHYKKSLLLRRIERRMDAHKVLSLDIYLEILEAQREEQTALFEDILINVTQFFRDPEAFECVGRECLQTFFKHRTFRANTIRLWIVGCASGEEAYSFSMLCLQEIRHLRDPPKVQIFATDVDEKALETARTGIYSELALAGVPGELREKYFTRMGDSYQVTKQLRDSVIFAHHDLIADPPLSRIDLVSCRNVFIYFEEDLQKRLLSIFHESLNKDGFLLLGAAETLGVTNELFKPRDSKMRLYSKNQPRPLVAVGAGHALKPRLELKGHFLQAGRGDIECTVPLEATPVLPKTLDEFQEAVHHLSSELQATRRDLKATIAELERSNREIIEANEELQTLNSTLISTSDELAASQGDLQSANEELESVNAELQIRLDELSVVNDDIHNLLVGTDIATLVLDASLCIKRYTPAVSRIFRIIPADIGRPISHLTHSLLVEDLVTQFAAALLTSAQGEYQVRTREGEWYIMRVLPYRTELNLTSGVVVTLTNVTQLKDVQDALRVSENKISALFHAIPDTMIVLREDGVVVDFKPGKSEFEPFLASLPFGRKLSELKLRDAQIERSYLRLMEQAAASVLRHGGVEECEIKAHFHNGSTRHYEVRLVNSGNNLAVGILRDITERKGFEATLLQSRSQAENASRAKSDFLANMSHELRTPLNAIIGFAEFLEGDPALAKQDSAAIYLGNIASSGRHLLRLVNEILDLSKIESGHMELSVSRFQVQTVIREVVSLCRPLAEQKGIVVSLDFCAEPLTIEADKERLKQIVYNLLSNALKFTPSSGEVKVALACDPECGAVVSVLDSGPGIAPSDWDRIFERFEQVKNAQAQLSKMGVSQHRGTGLGLTLVRSLVELHGGKVHVSCPGLNGQGSAFTFWLPFAQN